MIGEIANMRLGAILGRTLCGCLFELPRGSEESGWMGASQFQYYLTGGRTRNGFFWGETVEEAKRQAPGATRPSLSLGFVAIRLCRPGGDEEQGADQRGDN